MVHMIEKKLKSILSFAKRIFAISCYVVKTVLFVIRKMILPVHLPWYKDPVDTFPVYLYHFDMKLFNSMDKKNQIYFYSKSIRTKQQILSRVNGSEPD